VPSYQGVHRRGGPDIIRPDREPIKAELVDEPTRSTPAVRPRSGAPARKRAKGTVYESRGRTRARRARETAEALTPAAEEYARRAAIRGSSGGRPSVTGRAGAGAAAGAAAGAPLAAATGGLSIPIGAAIGGTAGAVGGRKAQRAYDKALRNPETGAARRVLLVEFTACMLIAALSPLTRKEDSPGRVIKQMTGLMLLFFILALVSAGGRGAARTASAFGGVVLVVLLVSSRDLFVKVAEIMNKPSKAARTSSGDRDSNADEIPAGWAMGARIMDVLALVFIVLIVYVLVRPRSKAADLVQAIGDMLISIVRAATNLAREGV
jgi:protein-S-isoprenylcysteine O-methyltransferase Ste14